MIAATKAPSTRKQLSFFPNEMNESDSRIQKIISERKKNTEIRKERIRKRFDEKYNIERKRVDDVINELADEFCLAKSTIETALKD